ncbi:hypothetical protein [Nostoc sp. LPT]|uniref:hypothetical protein n=1 Tax=Nostoc sp. LPT TaxID=2815387 RepID=UPI001D55041F|nr:hypothetical protein [Nostoc sp. LPT]MBN4006201.1 hypothetical protein [Nostoc sp. LPT]
MNFSLSGVDWLEERNPTFQDFVEFHDLQLVRSPTTPLHQLVKLKPSFLEPRLS